MTTGEKGISMPTQVQLPKIGFSMSEGKLAEWLVPDGAVVTEGQVIYALETEKATEEVEAPASGKLKIIGVVGETYQVGEIIGEIS
jgi:pyruvate/2-oxoglutarate dehydrogenase complex dihydrolipoamide acyltransferase (E2) component